MDLNPTVENFHGWIPIRLYWRENNPFIDWCYSETERFTQPFFDDTIQFLLRKPFNLLFRHQTSLEFLAELYEHRRGLAPNGFIFHMSRCGSTLVSQMLASLPKNIVISEAPPIDAVINANLKNSGVTDERRIAWLRWIVNAFGQKRTGDENFYFIKFDSWSTLDLELIRRAFPEVPWIFLYRNPVEVIVSQMRQRGSQMVPGVIDKLLPGMALTEAMQIPPEEYCGRVLARICESALTQKGNPNAKFVNYQQLPEAAVSTVLEHFDITYSAEEIGQMESAARFDAKTPRLQFIPDSEKKKSEASDAASRAANDWVEPFYRQLETIRRTADAN